MTSFSINVPVPRQSPSVHHAFWQMTAVSHDLSKAIATAVVVVAPVACLAKYAYS